MKNNPRRVPPVMEALDPIQEGAPRTINPVGSDPLHVGNPLIRQEITIMDRPNEYHIVKTSEVRQSRDGKRFVQFAEGTRVPNHTAYDFGLIDTDPATGLIRPGDEKPAVAENDEPVFTQERAKGAAPENRAKKA